MRKFIVLFILSTISPTLFGQYALDFEIGSDYPLLGPYYFYRPQAISVTEDGTQYIADAGNDRIQVINAAGKLIQKFGRRGSGNGEFISPASIALDATGKIYVIDRMNHRVQIFRNDGSFYGKFGSQGSGDGQFFIPACVAVQPNGELVVVDQGNDRVQVFSNDGTFLRKFGSFGSGNGQFSSPSSVAINSNNEILICDLGNNRIQVFNDNGVFQRTFGAYGFADGEFKFPSGIAVDGGGNVYVSDTDNHRIQVISSTGTFIRKFGSFGKGDGQFSYPDGLTIDKSGAIYVVDGDNDRIQVFTNDGTFTKSFGQNGNADAYFSGPEKVAYANNRIYVTDSHERAFYILDESGNVIRKVTSTNNWAYLFSPVGIALDAAGNIYVADGPMIQVYTGDGDYLRTIATSPPGGNSYLGDIVLDEEGRIYVADKQAVRVFTNAGIFLFSIGMQGTGDGQFTGQPAGLDYHSGKLYVVDLGNSRIQIFDKTGVFLSKFGSSGTGDGQFVYPNDITVASNGYMYVVESHRLQLFDENGVFKSMFAGSSGSGLGQITGGSGVAMKGTFGLLVTEGFFGNARIQEFSVSGIPDRFFGNRGTAPGQFHADNPGKIQIDSNGNIYVTDGTRIQIFDSSGKYLRSIGSYGSGDGQFASLSGIVVAADGKIYTSEVDNHRIQVFNNDGSFIRKFGSFGVLDGQFIGPVDLALDVDGNIYVAELFNSRVSVYNNAGVFLRKFGTPGTADGQFQSISGIQIHENYVYVLDGNINLFDLNGNFISKKKDYMIQDIDFDAGANGYIARETFLQLRTPDLEIVKNIGSLKESIGIAVSANGNRVVLGDKRAHRVMIYKFNGKQDHIITLADSVKKQINSPAFELSPKTSAGFSVVYVSSNPLVATISGNTVTIVGIGETIITGSHPGNAFYNEAPSVSQVLTVSKVKQIIRLNLEKSFIPINQIPFTLPELASSGLPIVYSSSDPAVASVTGNTVTIHSPGTTTISASQSGNNIYLPAPSVSQQIYTYGSILELSGDLVFSEPVPENGTATKSYVIRNRGNIPISVSNITLPLFFFTKYQSKTVFIPPAESVSISIWFTPPWIDFFEGDVEITSDAYKGNNVFHVSATNVVTGLETPESDQVMVSPNPGSGHYFITLREQPILFSLINPFGVEIKIDGRLISTADNEYQLNIEDLSSGIYLLKGEFATHSVMLRIVKY